MPKKGDLGDFAQHFASAQRPQLTTHLSSSLPTTPDLRARKPSFSPRSPPPEKVRQNGSPKSAHSDVLNSVRSRSKAPSIAGCKYETGMAFSRRRIPYSIGGDFLERPKAMPKKYLNPTEEEKLSGDMRELYDRLLPSQESDQRRSEFVLKLERILNHQWPGSDVKVHVFGSSGNMLCTSDSDVDICITTPMKALERMCLLAQALAEHGMERVVCVPHAKVPIVKFWDRELQLACDMNVNNTLALENTRMIKTYVEIDERVRPLAMIIKQWTKRRILNDAALGGTLSSYTWICLILNFLQTRNPPILPSLHKKPHLRKLGPDGQPASFDDDLERLRGFGHANNETLGELLFHFFRRYAYDLDFERNVISVREGKLISKEGKKWHLMQNNRLCVEEPFNTERNLGNTADDTSFRGIHLELRLAFDFVKDAQLQECLEEYVFPATEEKIWEKPASKPPQIVIRSRSQSQSSRGSRGGHGSRGGGRHGPGAQRNSGRRASSAAALNKLPLPPVGVPGAHGRDYPSRETLQAQYEQLQLHHDLFNKFHFLQQQEQELRYLQAQTQIQAQMQVQGTPNGTVNAPQELHTRELHQRAAGSSQIPMTAPTRSGQFYYPYQYPQVLGTPQQNIHTQPSSPSMNPLQPELRRSIHRSATAENHSANHRSHSQPARPLPPGLAIYNAPPIPASNNAILQYQQQVRQQHLYDALELAQNRPRPVEMPLHQDPRRMTLDYAYDENEPKEYVGYWLNGSPPQLGFREDHRAPRRSTYQDLHPRVRGVPHNLSRFRDASRSPSPSPVIPFRDRSLSVRSASSAPPQSSYPRMEKFQLPMSGSRMTGPVTMNGNEGWIMPDYSMRPDTSSLTTTLSETTSGSEDRTCETTMPTGCDATVAHGLDNGFPVDERQPHSQPQQVPESSHMPLAQRSANSDLPAGLGPPHLPEIGRSPTSSRGVETYGKPDGGLGIRFGEHELCRPSLQTENKLPSKITRSVAAPTTTEAKSEQKAPMPVALLSPVREVRTPSPTTRRKEDVPMKAQRPQPAKSGIPNLYIPSFAELSRTKQQREKNALEQKVNGVSSRANEIAKSCALPSQIQTNLPMPNTNVVEAPEESPRGTVHHPQINGWQQQSGKKSNRRKSGHTSGQVAGESIPANEADRKGG